MREWILLVVLSFLPPIVYAVWIRNTERCHRQQWWSIFMVFLWGASLAVLASLILEVLLQIPLVFSVENAELSSLLTVVVIAPVVEEFAKPLALRLKSVKPYITEVEDGLIYGAVAGLGFSATENLFYGYSFFEEGLMVFLVLMVMRSIGGCLLHASATAWTGYGYAKVLVHKSMVLRILPYFLFAIVVHGLYNFLVSFETVGVALGLFMGFTFVFISITLVRKKIRSLDKQNC